MLSLHTHANRELKALTDNTGGLAEINMSDKTSRLEGQLRTGKQFHAELPDVPRRAASTSATPLPTTTTAQPLVIGQAGSAQLMAISLSASFPGFTSAHEMNRWLEGVSALDVTQGKTAVDLVKGQFPLELIDQLKTLEVTTQTSWENLKAKLLELCGGAKADDKAAAEARWEALKMEDYDSVANFDVYFYAAAKKCRTSEERQFAQYKKAMSASLKKSIDDAWLHPADLTYLKSSMQRYKAQQEKRIREQTAMEREMRDAESSIAATMEQVEINSDDEVPDEVIAAFKEDWKRKRQQGTMSKFKATSVNRNKKPSREPMKCWNCGKPGHRMAECPDVKH